MAETINNAKVKLTNLAPWMVYFQRNNMAGEVTIPENGVAMVDRDEVESQFYANNRLFTGSDGHGAHARIIIDDKPIRDNFDIPEDQLVLTDEALDKAFAYKQQAAFEKFIKEHAVEFFEKHRLVEYIKRKKINDYQKIRFVETYTGLTVDM